MSAVTSGGPIAYSSRSLGPIPLICARLSRYYEKSMKNDGNLFLSPQLPLRRETPYLIEAGRFNSFVKPAQEERIALA